MPNLGGGGAERVISILLNNLDRKLFKPKLIIIKKEGVNVYIDDLKEDIEIVNLGIKHGLKFSTLTFLSKLLVYIKKDTPDILFMGAGTINAFISPFLFLFPKGIKKIARESNLPSLFERFKIIKYFYKKFYNNYDAIIAQSDDMVNELVTNFNVDKNKIKKINNPVDSNYIFNKLKESDDFKLDDNKVNLLAAGRLTYQKGFDLLINEFSKITNNNYFLIILGDGEDKEILKKQVKKLELEDKIKFLGNVKNPYIYMQKADLFILSSRFEGFPNVLLESLICGCPILANDCPGGIREIVEEGINGYIYSYNEQNFKSKLEKIKNMDFDNKIIRQNALKKYGIESIIPVYSKLLLEI
ncbi:glycosyltransferase [Lutibacter sp. B1]|uniref:glycosyltransferase n=1 Tax=Lutibacter sp. B1 TaxID=2725996 RepID=UPI001456E57E|nr:glycosyltransferase [Lutibacter sp. B1]NLP58825.1 glycosyltransferase [Lutibacter sp. B1]